MWTQNSSAQNKTFKNRDAFTPYVASFFSEFRNTDKIKIVFMHG